MQNKNGALGRQMKVSELSRESDIAPSAIHYYVQLGVLHRPKKVGLNLHLYDETHLARLKQIRQMKEKKGLSLAEIKEALDRGKPQPSSVFLPNEKAERGQSATTTIREGESGAEREEQENREKILDMAIQLFSERGFENTKVSDITEALRMGKGTFYVYFKNKRELFMECIDRLGVAIVPREAWDEIRKEQEYIRKNKKRGEAFLRAFPGYRGILNMVRGAIGGRDPVLAQKATEAFRVLSRPLLKDLRRAIAEGTVQIKYDEAFVAYLQLVLAEGFGYWQMIDSRYSVEEGMQILQDIFEHGLIHRGPSHRGPVDQEHPQGEVEYGEGMKAQLRDIAVDGEHALRGRMGDAEVDVDLNKLVVARFHKDGGRQLAQLTTEEGQQLELEVDAEHHLSGMATFGSIRIPLKRIVSISFDEAQHLR
jgi:AcrR family transcriptional regulator